MQRDVLSNEQQIVLEKFTNGENIFITGPGGVGKTFLIKKLYETAIFNSKNVSVCALTGCAAVLLGCNAKTVNSWAGVGLLNKSIDEIIDNINKNKKKKKIWKKTDVLIIDEVSMMSKKMFMILNLIGQRIRGILAPFGGIQLVFSGDFYQLPPVGDDDDEDSQKFCFESPLWNETFNNQIVLKTNYRQNDELFKKILNGIRIGKLSKTSYQTLLSRVGKETSLTVTPPILYPRKESVNSINNRELGKLDGDIVKYECICLKELAANNDEIIKSRQYNDSQKQQEYEYLKKNIMPGDKVILKKGSNVMCIINLDMESSICNGSQGTVVDFVNGQPVVYFNNGIKRIISNHIWKSENIPDIGVSQIPLILSWAITIHKAQGLTLDSAILDIGNDIFECGQSYVALSRIKSIEGVYLKSFTLNKIKINKKVMDFYNNLK